MAVSARQRFTIESELRQAIVRNELRLFLQPQVDAQGRPLSAEVLIRWQHPERGLLSPVDFIPIAEESDLIVAVGAWVLSQSCQLMAREAAAGFPLRLSVNVSPRQFRQPGFVPLLRDLIQETGAEPSHLMLEVTEGLFINNLSEVILKMDELTQLGVRFSIDDFGTGYSSLSYLKRMPIVELKIDKSFIQDITIDPNDAALVETILSVAQHLHYQVVAEGVETLDQVEFIKQRANVLFQGYYFGRPALAESWIEKWRADVRTGTQC
jgi:EAL domain-containing protein (putative c-di-GMP-specific phosphodiesterase class I)